MTAPQSMVEPALGEAAAFIERTLDALLPKPAGPEARLMEAMRYTTLGGGKRLRGFLVLQSARLFGVDRGAAGRVGAAVECVHAYSLVHDDLPAMDDDDMRRGKLSAHKAFDEATAILAGDALLTFAFTLISSPDAHGDPFVRCELVQRLAQSAGYAGMVGGQMMDMALEGASAALAEISRLQRMKTAALITFSCEAGAILGKASQPMRAALLAYGQDLGLAFQIADDLLDAQGDAEQMGKAARKDAGRGKATIVNTLGHERARAQANALAEQAVSHLDLFDEKADLLRAVAQFVIMRRS
ncbi:MAG TPA: farnesyl diphosphate synthase [Rhizomicrobium sp.]|jgi:farnesyl diphosphate synthase|nr:farnesyl diphosphate synthase [Rhizomicrobium sp.]